MLEYPGLAPEELGMIEIETKWSTFMADFKWIFLNEIWLTESQHWFR